MILHRDHGWPDGWAEPTLHSGHVPFFTNGSQQPVVFGINCSSAAFDDPSHPSFVELQILRPDGGAIAGFGDTRVSPSFPNNHMALGFFDAMFPLTVADYGARPAARGGSGDILVRGKQYMATQEGFEWHGAGDTYVEHYLYHLLGDPTMQMWSEPPVRFDPSRFKGIVREIREFTAPRAGRPAVLRPDLGPAERALRQRRPSSRCSATAPRRSVAASSANGIANIIPDDPVRRQGDNLRCRCSRTARCRRRRRWRTRRRAAAGEPVATQLTHSCPADGSYIDQMTTTGRLQPGFAGATIKLTYTREDGTTFTRNATTDANGSWSDTITPQQHDGPNPFFQFGTWKVRAQYAGDAGHKASSSPDCGFEVND